MPAPFFLDHRSVISVSGADAEGFLQGLLTISTADVREGELRYGALLTPQGKIIADMILVHEGDGFLIDCDAGVAPVLVKKLKLFRLRAAVAIEERSDLGVRVFEGAADPRSAEAPRRSIVVRKDGAADAAAYHAARIAAVLAEQGIDFGAEEVFPADINMDLVNGIDFKKGCFVGQEVVSRMKRRGTARRRTLTASVAAGTPAPCPVLANDFEIGTLTSVSGEKALVRVRVDRMADAQAKGEAITANGAALVFHQPDWLADALEALKEAKA